ncbi:BZ3500_MvSof-1268-A1-R1_Chr1-3g02305 [Microbotryum saponariae]|uniref:BZ3500_MvSof-1268-A1-R1_Chr1-3g02305 protein n=1 Tax=Microbotryum saponariae TaxID=289078 RepID=A0A2X0KBX5_9BASI|nr:BZ3500_MvSof-1268-A1-R1_Chr1-3g02305 [Microbotryum saponariae]
MDSPAVQHATSAAPSDPLRAPRPPSHRLPPSPPSTDSSHKHTPEDSSATHTTSGPTSSCSSSSPSSSSSSDTAIVSPSMPYARKSSSPSTSVGALSPLAPLPNEVFLLIVQQLTQVERTRLCLVSRSWATFLHNEPRLWPKLRIKLGDDDFGVAHFETWLRRASVSHTRHGGGLQQLTIVLSGQRTRLACYPLDRNLSDLEYVQRLQTIVDMVRHACLMRVPLPDGKTRLCSSLRHLKFISEPSTSVTVMLAHTLVQFARDPLLGDLDLLDMYFGTPLLPASWKALWSWPTVTTVSLRCGREMEGEHQLDFSSNWCLQPPGGPLSSHLYALEHISMRGIVIVPFDSTPMVMPTLTTIVLVDVDLKGMSIYAVVKAARHTLVHLELREVSIGEVTSQDAVIDHRRCIEQHDPHLLAELRELQTNGHFREFGVIWRDEAIDDDGEVIPADPTPIILPVLRSLILQSEITLPIFTSLDSVDTGTDDQWLPTPFLLMPSLESADLIGLTIDAHDAAADETRNLLVVLGLCAPYLTSLSVTECDYDETSLAYCLMALKTTLCSLVLYDTTTSDQLIANLARLAPTLETLDVQHCKDISAQGVARLVEVIREQSGGLHKLSTVRIDHPQTRDVADLTAYEWLDFIGALCRDETDYESLGPRRYTAEWFMWKKDGKLDVMHPYKERMRLEEELVRQQQEAQRLRAQSFAVAQSPREAQGSHSGGAIARNGIASPPMWHRNPLAGPGHTPGPALPRGAGLAELAALQQQRFQLQETSQAGSMTWVGISLQGIPMGAVGYAPRVQGAPPTPVTPSTAHLHDPISDRADAGRLSSQSVNPTIVDTDEFDLFDGADVADDSLSDDDDLDYLEYAEPAQ